MRPWDDDHLEWVAGPALGHSLMTCDRIDESVLRLAYVPAQSRESQASGIGRRSWLVLP